MSAAQKSSASKGFTLVELMIVVSVVGILSSIAIPEFLDMQLRARRSEAYINLKGIATAQVAYHELYSDLVDCTSSPSTPLDRSAYPFDRSAAGWTELGWVPDGDVRCHYAARKYTNDTGAWVRGQATCDMDDDNLVAAYYVDIDPDETEATSEHLVIRPSASTAAQVRY